MNKFLLGMAIGGIMGVLIFSWITSDPKIKDLKDVKVAQVSGEKITHSGFNYTSDVVKFTTEAEGKGKIITEIPKTNIPEAKAWIQNNNAVMLELLFVEQREYGISYLRRWNNLSVGGGVVVSGKKFEGVKLQTQYWFSL